MPKYLLSNIFTKGRLKDHGAEWTEGQKTPQVWIGHGKETCAWQRDTKRPWITHVTHSFVGLILLQITWPPHIWKRPIRSGSYAVNENNERPNISKKPPLSTQAGKLQQIERVRNVPTTWSDVQLKHSVDAKIHDQTRALMVARHKQISSFFDK